MRCGPGGVSDLSTNIDKVWPKVGSDLHEVSVLQNYTVCMLRSAYCLVSNVYCTQPILNPDHQTLGFYC